MVPRGISRASELIRGLCCGALDVVFFERVRVARQIVAVVQHLVAQREPQQDRAGARPAPTSGGPPARAALRAGSASPILLIPASSANTRKFATIAVFPELRNGDTTPESGSAPSTPEVISSISQAMSVDEARCQKEPICGVGALGRA